MNNSKGCNDKGEQEMEGKEPSEGGVVDRESPSDSLDEGASYIRHGRQ